MDVEEFRRVGKEMIDYIADYVNSVRSYDVVPLVEPGFLTSQLPTEAPADGDGWKNIFADFEKFIMPGILHWRSPRFHGYICNGHSLTSIVGEMLTAAFNNVVINWMSSPAGTELDMVVADWVGQMLGLPRHFLCQDNGYGGGVCQESSTSCFPIVMLCAQEQAKQKYENQGKKREEIASVLVCYISEEAHISVQRAATLTGLILRKVETDDELTIRGHALQLAIEKDKAMGLVPCFVLATIGTTGSGAVDNLEEIGQICTEEDLWLHVDAAYAGSAFVCPEYRYLLAGIEHVTSITVNPHKWMLCTMGASILWLKDRRLLENCRVSEKICYLHTTSKITESKITSKEENTLDKGLKQCHSNTNVDGDKNKTKHQNENSRSEEKDPKEYFAPTLPELMGCSVNLGKRFVALKLWIVIRRYGISGIQAQIKRHVALAHQMEIWLKEDGRFELVSKVVFGLVCFRLKGPNALSKQLFDKIREEGKILLSYNMKKKGTEETFYLRCAMASEALTHEDLAFTFHIIKTTADFILGKCSVSERGT